ncbi:DNA double-strand break repair protein Mre11 [uncultured archaeon]|nr:DNA double-strand break repair protein Mre11 [uncultured archaeon]
MPNLICISDSHLGFRHRLKTQRLKDYARCFTEAVEKGRLLDPGVFLFGGDLFHHVSPDPKSVAVVFKTLMTLADEYPVVVLVGNHEIAGHLGTSLSPVAGLLHENIHVLTTENPHAVIAVGGEKVGFHGFQFIRGRKTAEEALLKITQELPKADKHILAIHQAVEGYLSPFELSARALQEAASNYDLIVIGHVHKHQPIKEVDSTPSYYIGSTERTSFSEHLNPAGFLAFDLSDLKKKPKHTPVSAASMRSIKMKLGRLKPDEINKKIDEAIEENNNCSLLSIDAEADVDGDYMSVRRNWEETYPNFTILDVRITPPTKETTEFTFEQSEINEDTVRQYLKKTKLDADKELAELTIELYNKHARP